MARTQIVGLEETLRRLQRMPRDGRAARDDALHDWAEATEETARQLVPVDTGNLRRDLDQRVYEAHGVAYVGVWKTEDAAKYAFFVEKGTSKMADQPFLQPAFDRNQREIADALRRRLDERLGGG